MEASLAEPVGTALLYDYLWKLSIFTIILVLCFVIDHLRSRGYASLDEIPGPWLARKTKLYMVHKQRGQRRPWADIALHEKYGPIVRIAPNEVMVSSPSSFRTIFAGQNFKKGEWYQGLGDAAWRGPNMFHLMIETNLDKFRAQRRLIGPAYSSVAMKQEEDIMDKIINEQIDIMMQRAGLEVDIESLFNKFISDCIAQVTFSTHNNLLKSDRDDGSIRYTLRLWNYMCISGYFPWIHFLLISCRHYATYFQGLMSYMFPQYAQSKGLRSKAVHSSHPWAFLKSQILKRIAKNKTQSDMKVPADVIAKLFSVQQQKPQLSDEWIASMCATNFGAGMETTSITITALVYQVLANSGCQARIQAEIDQARAASKLSYPPKIVEFKDLKYLDACLRESMRLHHVIGMPLPRVVPVGGTLMEGIFLPAGTTVSINPWVLNRDKDLYGQDADEWRPERWLEYSIEKQRELSAHNFTFGSGLRSRPGKHLAEALYSKIIPLLFARFEWELINPTSPPVILSTVTVRYHGLMGRWKVRE